MAKEISRSVGGEVGQQAPEIDLPKVEAMVVGSAGSEPAAGEGHWRLRDHRGHTVVLHFYPRDETPVCTQQLCAVRDQWSEYQATGAVVVGINTDSLEAHRSFRTRYQFPFPLLSDAQGEVVRAYGMTNLLGVRRGVIVIDSEGVVRYRKVVFPLFRPSDEEVLAVIRSLV
jgi:peroxiredoxin Q/BCP